jgi:hypothetical protein
MASGPTQTSKVFRPRTSCELLASARSGGGRVSIASRELLARQRAGHRIPTCPCDASREHPRRSERQDDIPRRARVKDFRRCAPRNSGHAVHSDARAVAEMPVQTCFSTNRQMHRKLRAVGSETTATTRAAAHIRRPSSDERGLRTSCSDNESSHRLFDAVGLARAACYCARQHGPESSLDHAMKAR